MSERYARVQNIDFKNYKRVIAVSDIHGDLQGFRGLLSRLHLTDQDALVIVGDMIEKGEHSLEVLELALKYMAMGNTFLLSGNNEAFLIEWYNGTISDTDMFQYTISKPNNLLTEMAERLTIVPDSPDALSRLRQEMQQIWQEEWNLLLTLPQIIDSSLATFVHAGLQPGSLHEQDYWYCLSVPEFGRQTHVFEKPVIVGHWPASNYCDTIINVNPYFSLDTNVISIDGGNSMKSWAQINYLIIDPANGNIENGYYDSLPKIRALDAQKGTKDAVTLVFPNTRIEIRERYPDASLCYVPHLDRELTVLNDRIYEYKNNMYCYDFTTYDLPVEAGEILSLCRDSEGEVLVKRDGIVGNYRGRYERL